MLGSRHPRRVVSSSVEFSSEFGFSDDNAMEIVEIAIEKAKEK